MNSEYIGHGRNTGAIQQHSIGALYPYIIFGQETPCGLMWGVENASTGEDCGLCITHESAVRWARGLLNFDQQIERLRKMTEAV